MGSKSFAGLSKALINHKPSGGGGQSALTPIACTPTSKAQTKAYLKFKTNKEEIFRKSRKSQVSTAYVSQKPHTNRSQTICRCLKLLPTFKYYSVQRSSTLTKYVYKHFYDVMSSLEHNKPLLYWMETMDLYNHKQ